MNTRVNLIHVPTPEEVRVIESAARRAQAEEMWRLTGLAIKGLKALAVRAVNSVARLRRRPATIAGHRA